MANGKITTIEDANCITIIDGKVKLGRFTVYCKVYIITQIKTDHVKIFNEENRTTMTILNTEATHVIRILNIG